MNPKSANFGRRLAMLDRWLLNLLFPRRRLFRVRLDHCIDEFGHSFGQGGTHFFVAALRAGEDVEAIARHLGAFYAGFPIRSFNDTVGGSIGSPAGDCYFCPWEQARIRPLSKFEHSHKAGPTPDEALPAIAERLLGVLRTIRRDGFRQLSILGGIPQVIALEDRQGRRKYIMRDGQHRAAVLSHLGVDSMLASYPLVHFAHSWLFRALSRAGGAEKEYASIVREADAESWWHVRNGTVSIDDALKFFQSVFQRAPLPSQTAGV